MALRVVAAFENIVAAGANVSTALLPDRFSPSARRLDQDACSGAVGGRHKSGGGVGGRRAGGGKVEGRRDGGRVEGQRDGGGVDGRRGGGRIDGRRRGSEGVGRTTIDVVVSRGGMIIALRRAWERVSATTTEVSSKRIRVGEASRRGIPWATAIVRNQVRAHGEVIHAEGRIRDRFAYCGHDSVRAQERELELPGIHRRCVYH